MHDNNVCNNQLDNLKYDSVHNVNSECIPPFPVQEEILFGNAGNYFDVNGSSPHASSSYIPPVSHELRSGSSFLTDLLLCNHMSGITASPFIANLDTLQKSVSLHGIVLYGLSHEDYKTILLRHIFGGGCAQGPHNNDRTACRHFAQDFTSPRQITRFAFDVMSSAKSNQRSTDELLFLFHTLELTTAFKPRNLRRQIVHELKKQSENFVSPMTANKEFTAFEKHDRLTLLSIASLHHIQIDRFTSTKEKVKTAIISHFALGECCHNVNKEQGNTCAETVESILSNNNLENSSDLHTIRNQFIYDWLILQHKNLSQNPLVRLLKILDIEFDPQDNSRALRSHLKKFITALRIQTNQPVDKKIELDRKLARLHSEWPTIVPQSLKDKLIKLFREQTSSAFLTSVTCASCAESCLASESTKVNVKNVNLNVLERPNC